MPHMLQFTQEHKQEGRSLQKEILQFQDELRCSIDEIWAIPEINVGDPERPQNPADKILKPEVVEPAQWRVKLWDIRESRLVLS